MISGVGIDIVEIKRIKSIVERQPRFIERILTEDEQAECLHMSLDRKLEFIAGRFSAKEAFSKAMGTGIGGELTFLHIEIGREKSGKPYIKKPFSEGVHLSITHSKEYAFAQVIIEKI